MTSVSSHRPVSLFQRLTSNKFIDHQESAPIMSVKQHRPPAVSGRIKPKPKRKGFFRFRRARKDTDKPANVVSSIPRFDIKEKLSPAIVDDDQVVNLYEWAQKVHDKQHGINDPRSLAERELAKINQSIYSTNLPSIEEQAHSDEEQGWDNEQTFATEATTDQIESVNLKDNATISKSKMSNLKKSITSYIGKDRNRERKEEEMKRRALSEKIYKNHQLILPSHLTAEQASKLKSSESALNSARLSVPFTDQCEKLREKACLGLIFDGLKTKDTTHRPRRRCTLEEQERVKQSITCFMGKFSLEQYLQGFYVKTFLATPSCVANPHTLQLNAFLLKLDLHNGVLSMTRRGRHSTKEFPLYDLSKIEKFASSHSFISYAYSYLSENERESLRLANNSHSTTETSTNSSNGSNSNFGGIQTIKKKPTFPHKRLSKSTYSQMGSGASLGGSTAARGMINPPIISTRTWSFFSDTSTASTVQLQSGTSNDSSYFVIPRVVSRKLKSIFVGKNNKTQDVDGGSIDTKRTIKEKISDFTFQVGLVSSKYPPWFPSVQYNIRQQLKKPCLVFFIKKMIHPVVCIYDSQKTRHDLINLVCFLKNYYEGGVDIEITLENTMTCAY